MSELTDFCRKYHLDESSITPEQIRQAKNAIKLADAKRSEPSEKKSRIYVVIDTRKKKGV